MKLLITILVLYLGVCNLHCAGEEKTVKIISPKNRAIIENKRPTLKWKPLKGAERYTVAWYEIDPKTNRTIKTVQPIEVYETEYTLKEDVIENRLYEWSVMAFNSHGALSKNVFSSFLTDNVNQNELMDVQKKENMERKVINKKLGLSVDNLGVPFSNPNVKGGVIVKKINPDSPFSRSDLQTFDIIVSFDQNKIIDITSLYEIAKQTEKERKGKFKVIRGFFEKPKKIQLIDMELRKQTGAR